MLGSKQVKKKISLQGWGKGEKLADLLSQCPSQVNKTNICLINKNFYSLHQPARGLTSSVTALPIAKWGRWNWASCMQLFRVHTEAGHMQTVSFGQLLSHQHVYSTPMTFWWLYESPPPPKQSSLKQQ